MTPLHDIPEIDDVIDRAERRADSETVRATLTNVPVNTSTGMIEYRNATEIGEMAKLLASGGIMLPEHLRNSPGGCALTLMAAIKWRLDFAFVASQQYVQNGRVSYMSQLFRAVMENSGVIKGRMRHSYEGDGMERRCKVWATFKGETEPHVHTSPPLKELLPEKNAQGQYKGSPLWKRKPDQQMLYDTQRDWVRMYAPDIISGVYDPDELAEQEMKTVNTSETKSELTERLRQARQAGAESERRGFNVGNVEREIDGINGKPEAKKKRGRVIEGEVEKPEEKPDEAKLEAARERGAADGAAKVVTPLDFDLRAEGREAEWEAYQQAYLDNWPDQ